MSWKLGTSSNNTARRLHVVPAPSTTQLNKVAPLPMPLHPAAAAPVAVPQKALETPEDLPLRRLARLFDGGRFEQLDALVRHQASGWGVEKKRVDGDGVVVATGFIHGKPAIAFAQDRRVMGGSLGEAHARKICKGMDLAERMGAPIIGLLDSGGARIQEGVAALSGYGEIFRRNVALSGKIPQISVVLGPCAGGAVYSPSLTDFVILSEEDALMFVTGPKVVKQVMFEEVDSDKLGGAKVHSKKSGVAHIVRKDEAGAIAAARDVLGYLLEKNGKSHEPARAPALLGEIVPEDFRRSYDIRHVIESVADARSFLEIQPDYAKNIVVGFARMEGRTVGIIANQPKERAGVLDIDSARKGARFIRTMDAFGVPIVSFIDVPGFMPGAQQEHGGIITHGAKILYAYCEARVPRLSVITRKAFGGAYIVMSSKHLGADVNLAWPQAQISVMGAEGAVEILHGKELKDSAEPEKKFKELCDKYREEYMTVRLAAERGWIDEVVEPSDTRGRLLHYLALLGDSSNGASRERHGNIPL